MMQISKILLGSILVVGAVAVASANQPYSDNKCQNCNNNYNANNNNKNNGNYNGNTNNNYQTSKNNNNYNANNNNNQATTYSDKPYGPYHSYAVQPTTYGGQGLYTYKGYNRHAPSYSMSLKPANVLVLVPAGRPRYNSTPKRAPCHKSRRPRTYGGQRGGAYRPRQAPREQHRRGTRQNRHQAIRKPQSGGGY